MRAKLAILMAVFMALSAIFAIADTCSGDLCVVEVEVDGDNVNQGDLIVMDRGNDLDVRVRLETMSDMKDIQLQAIITGYEHGVIEDSSTTFDMRDGRVYSKDFTLSIPSDLSVSGDNDGHYKLRLIVGDSDSDTIVFDYDLQFEAERHDVEIKDIMLDPSREVVAGRGVIAAVRVKNVGQKDENDGVKVMVSIPALGVESSEFIDELDTEESTTSEDLFLRIPECAQPGTYVVRAEAEYNNGRDSVSDETSITVVENPTCSAAGSTDEESKTVITVPKAQPVQAGSEAVYPIMITNTGSSSKQYLLSVSGVESWGSASLEGGQVVVVGPKMTQTAYLSVSANEDAAEGTQVFVVDIASGAESDSIALTANVAADQVSNEEPAVAQDWTSIKKGLEIGLVVLVVLLVILGLIVGFNKLKGNDDDEEISGQTYY